jgi:GNAT superfamily N-acetyltransferase
MGRGSDPGGSMTVVVRSASSSDWGIVRDLRLDALADSPHAFGERLVDAKAMSDAEWKLRLAPSGSQQWFVEEAAGNGLVGMAKGYIDGAPSTAMLTGLWVNPVHRRQGVGRRLIHSVEEWARTFGARAVELEVNPAMAEAERLYEACGYRRTGGSRPLPSDPSQVVVGMRKRI